MDYFKDRLKDTIKKRLEQNPRLSYRSLAINIGVSAATLVNYLNSDKRLSPTVVDKFIVWMKLSDEESLYLRLLLEYELTQEPHRKKTLEEKLLFYKNGKIFAEIEKNKTFLRETKPYKAVTYLHEETRHVRTLNFLQNKEGKKIRSFYEIVHAPHFGRNIGAYFIENLDRTFTCLIDENLSVEPRARSLHPSNENLNVQFDSDEFPTVHNLIGIETDPATNFLTQCTLTFTTENMTVDCTGALSDGYTDKGFSRKTTLIRVG